MSKTTAPFAPPHAFVAIDGRTNGGLRGLRAMRRAHHEWRTYEGTLRPNDKVINPQTGRKNLVRRLRNKPTLWAEFVLWWKQARAVELSGVLRLVDASA